MPRATSFPRNPLSDAAKGLGSLGQSLGFHGVKGLVGITHRLHLFCVWAPLTQRKLHGFQM